jgi:hypothetical protein
MPDLEDLTSNTSSNHPSNHPSVQRRFSCLLVEDFARNSKGRLNAHCAEAISSLRLGFRLALIVYMYTILLCGCLLRRDLRLAVFGEEIIVGLGH